MDRFSPIAPASVRALLLPVGHIERSTFLNVVESLRENASVLSLRDLSSRVDDDSFILSPLRFQDGSIFYNFTTSDVTEQSRQLSPFELWRESLLVIGIAAGLSDDAMQRDDELRKVAAELHDKHGRVVHRHTLVWTGSDIVSHLSDATVISDVNASTIVPAMHDITIKFLQELTTYAIAMQASPGIQTPGHVSQGMLRAMMLREDEGRPGSRHGTPIEPRTPPSEDGGSRPTSQDVGALPPPTTFDQISAANSLGRSDSNTSHRSKSRTRTSSFDRVPTHALSKDKLKDRGKARVSIVTGSIYLMSGQWAEALKLLVESTTRLRALNDHIWNAKGLELIALCLILHVWAGIDVQIPAIIFQLSDKVRDRLSKAFAADLAQKLIAPQSAVERLSSSLHALLRHVLLLYHSIEGNMELPYIAVAEATVRFCKILACLQSTNGVLNDESISRIVNRKIQPSTTVWSASTFLPEKPITKNSIADMLVRALPPSEDSIPLTDYVSILTGIASVYATLKMQRKKAVTLKALVTRLTAALIHARKVGAAEVGIHPAATLSLDNGTVSALELVQGSHGLSKLAQSLAAVYGVVLQDDSTISGVTYVGSRSLQLEILRDLLRLCEASCDLHGISKLVVAFIVSAGQYGAIDTTSRTLPTTIPAEEQMHMLTMFNRAIWLSSQLGLEVVETRYWDQFMLRGIEVLPVTPEQMITERPRTSSGELATINPLLYDPNAPRPKTKRQRPILPVGERAMVCLVLQNPLDVVVDLEHIQLVTDDLDLPSERRTIKLQPGCMQRVLFDINPTEVGTTNITGCRMKVAGCAEQAFLLTNKPYNNTVPVAIKAVGQDSLHDARRITNDPPVEHQTVPVEFIGSQPQLQAILNSVQDSRMLLEGEAQSYAISIKNISSTPAAITSIMSLSDNIRITHELTLPITVEPGAIYTQQCILVGVSAASSARISVAYASDAQSTYSRVCLIDVGLSVLPSLHVVMLDIIEVGSSKVQALIDLFNRWSKPIDFACAYGDENPTQAEHQLLPGETKRVRLVIPHSAIPATQAEFLARLAVRWTSGNRSGRTSLDQCELSDASKQAISQHAVDISLSLADVDTSKVPIGEFMIVRAAVKNNKAVAIGPSILKLQHHAARVIAGPSSPASVAGAFSRVLPALEPHEQKTFDFALCPLLLGSITIDAALRSALATDMTPLDSMTTQRLQLCVV